MVHYWFFKTAPKPQYSIFSSVTMPFYEEYGRRPGGAECALCFAKVTNLFVHRIFKSFYLVFSLLILKSGTVKKYTFREQEISPPAFRFIVKIFILQYIILYYDIQNIIFTHILHHTRISAVAEHTKDLIRSSFDGCVWS